MPFTQEELRVAEEEQQMKPRVSSRSLFSQRLDRTAFAAYFLGAIVPLCALAWEVQRHELKGDGAVGWVALLVSILFLSLQMATQPFRRSEDNWLATMAYLALVVVYLTVLLLKMCEQDAEVCEDDYSNLSCEDICQSYKDDRELCGSPRCATEADCVRDVMCNSIDTETGQILSTFSCQRVFSCEPSVLACEANYSLLSDDQICQECAATFK